jgi:hypothetical protein
MKLLNFLLFIFFIFSLNVQSVETKNDFYTLTVTLSHNEITLADTLKVDVFVTHEAGIKVDIIKLTRDLLQNNSNGIPPFSLMAKDIRLDKEKTRISYILNPKLEGDLELNIPDVAFIDEKNTKFTKNFLYLDKVRVINPEQSMLEFRGTPERLLKLSKQIPINLNFLNNKATVVGIKESKRNERLNLEKTLPWEKIFAALLSFLSFIIVMLQPKREIRDVEKEKQTAKVKALLNLKELQGRGLKIEKNYAELSNILRMFIEDSYHIKAKQQTTEEFLKAIQETALPVEFPQSALLEFLKISDLVKFAKKTPSEDIAEEGYRIVSKIVNN